MNDNTNFWKKCATCKKEIPYLGIYQSCSVSTCKKHAYCSVECWDVHVPVMNHKSAWAEEERAPSKTQALDSGQSSRRRVVSSKTSSSPSTNNEFNNDDILVVVSKLKNYIKNKHGLNTAADCMPILSKIIRRFSDDACDMAKANGRKTLQGRDFTLK